MVRRTAGPGTGGAKGGSLGEATTARGTGGPLRRRRCPLLGALSTRTRLRAQRERRPGAKGVEPLFAARAVVFGQASALVAALVAGMYGGTGVFLLSYLDIPPRRDQAIYAGAAVIAGIGVIAAALFLERVCRLPEDGNDHDGTGTAAA